MVNTADNLKKLQENKIILEQYKKENEDKILKLFAESKNISLNEAKDQIKTNEKIKKEYENFCATEVNKMMEKSKELIARPPLEEKKEFIQSELSKKESYTLEELQKDFTISHNLLEKINHGGGLVLKNINPKISRILCNILIKKMFIIANEKNLRKDERFSHDFKTNYGKKNNNGNIVLDKNKFINDTFVIRDVVENKHFSKIQIEGKELLDELGINSKEGDKSEKNIFKSFGLANKSIISEHIAWKETVEENSSRNLLGKEKFVDTGLNGINAIFERDNKDKISYSEVINNNFDEINKFRTLKKFTQLDILSNIIKEKKKISGALLTEETKLRHIKTDISNFRKQDKIRKVEQEIKAYKEELTKLNKLTKKIKNDPKILDQLNKESENRLKLGKLEGEISDFQREAKNQDNNDKLKKLEEKLETSKKNILSEQVKKYLELAKINKDGTSETLYESLLALIENNFDFDTIDPNPKINTEKQNLLVKEIFAPKIMEMFENNRILSTFGLDQKEIQKFARGLLNFENRNSIISLPNKYDPSNPLKLRVKKGFKKGAWNINNILDVDGLVSTPPNLEQLGDFPLDFDINLDGLSSDQQRTIENCPLLKQTINNKNINFSGKNINQIFQLFYYLNGNIDEYTENIISVEKKSKQESDALFGKDGNLSGGKARSALVKERERKDKRDRHIALIDNSENEINKNNKTSGKIDYLMSDDYYQQVYKNATTYDNNLRIENAIKKIEEIAKVNDLDYKNLSETQKQAIIEAHLVGEGEVGDDGIHYAGVFNYTPEHINKKMRILHKAKLETWQAKTLLYYGFCGSTPKKIAKEKANGFTDSIEEGNFSEEDWEKFEKKVNNEYKRFDDKETKETFKKTFEEKRDNIPEDTEDEEKEKERKRLDKIIKNLEENNKRDNSSEEGEEGNEETDEEERENERKRKEREEKEKEPTAAEKFDTAWNELSGDGDAKFEIGNYIYINVGDSNFPPKDNKNARIKIQIESTPSNKGEGKFKVKIYNATSDFESFDNGENHEFDCKAETLEHWVKEYGTDKVKKVKKIENNKNFEESLALLTNSGILGTNSTIFGPEKIYFKNDKFFQKTKDGEEEINYFCRTGSNHDNYMVGRKTQTYKINSIKNGEVDFESTYEDLDPKNASKKQKFKIKRKLSLPDFMLLMEDKQLYGYKEPPQDELEKAKANDRDPMKGKKTWFSFSDIFTAVKGGFKKINEGLDNYKQGEAAKFSNFMFSYEGLNLYEKGANFFGGIGGPFQGLADAFDGAALDFYAEREDRTWKMIDFYYQKRSKDPHFATLWRKKINTIITADPSKIQGGMRYKFAAAMLVVMKKDGPWNSILEGWMGKGEWVARILGKGHQEKFKKMLALKERELNNHEKFRNGQWKNPKGEQLNRFEFDYIIGAIDGRAPAKGEDENYNASVWGRKFVEELEGATNKYFGGISEKAKEIEGIKDFAYCQQEYYRNIEKMKPHKSLPYLVQMLRCPASEEERNAAKGALIGAMLSGVLWTHADVKTRSMIKDISRTIGFPAGMWVKDSDHKEKLWTLLNHITNNDISEKLKPRTPKEFSLTNNKGLGGFLTKTFWNYWGRYGNNVIKYLNVSDSTLNSEKNSILSLANDSKNPNNWVGKAYIDPEFDLDSIDTVARDAYEYNTDSPWLANKSIIRNYIPSHGKYVKQNSEVDIEAAKNFWNTVSSSLPSQINSRNEFKLLFGRFHSRFSEDVFGQGNLTKLLQTIPVVKKLKKQGRDTEGKYILWYTLYGIIMKGVGGAPAEFSSAINKFVDMTYSGIENFDLSMANDIFGNYTNTIKRDIKDNHYNFIDNPQVWNKFAKYVSISSYWDNDSSRIKKEFEENYGDNTIWEGMKSTMGFLDQENLLGEQPTPPWKDPSVTGMAA